MSPSKARARLAVRQAELMRALTGQTVTAPGFEQSRLEAAAQALARKRARAVSRSWPALCAALGDRCREEFAEYAAQTSLPQEGGPLADGRGFVDFLARTRRLPDAGRREALFVDLHHARSPLGLAPRRGITFKAALLREPPRLVVGWRLPLFGVRWFALPLFGFATNTSRPDTHPAPPAS